MLPHVLTHCLLTTSQVLIWLKEPNTHLLPHIHTHHQGNLETFKNINDYSSMIQKAVSAPVKWFTAQSPMKSNCVMIKDEIPTLSIKLTVLTVLQKGTRAPGAIWNEGRLSTIGTQLANILAPWWRAGEASGSPRESSWLEPAAQVQWYPGTAHSSREGAGLAAEPHSSDGTGGLPPLFYSAARCFCRYKH